MQILICDDDAATRLVLRRKLEQSIPGCAVQECGDGAEGLRALESSMFDLVVLDVEMPVIDGIAMLESIRRSPRLNHVPVLMASKERRSDVVARLVQLGISGYVLKPLRPRTLTDSIEQLKVRMRLGGGGRTTRPMPKLAPGSPALIVDGEAHYRRFIVEQARRHGTVLEAASGTDALAVFQRTPTSIVFVGTRLGVHSADLLVQRLRAEGVQPPLVVGITDSRSADRKAYDETMRRTMVPALHQAELMRFVPAAGALAALSTRIGDLSEIVLSDAQQVLGLMLDCEVTCSAEDPPAPELSSSVTVTVDDRFLITVAAHMSETAARSVASRLCNLEPSRITEARLLDSTSEIARLLGARLHALANQREQGSTLSDATAIRGDAAVLPPALEESGLSMTFAIAAIGADVVVRVEVEEVRVPGVEDPGTSLASVA